MLMKDNTKVPLILEKHIFPCLYQKGQKLIVRMGFYKGFIGIVTDLEIHQGWSKNTTIYLIKSDTQSIYQPEENLMPKRFLGIF